MTIIKGKILRNDLSLYDGVNNTDSRRDSTGGTIQGFRVGGQVDVLGLYGTLTRRAILDAATYVGSNDATLLITPGTWEIDDNLTISIPCYICAGAVFNVASGKTLTFSGPIIRESDTWTSGVGTVSYTASINVIVHQSDLISTASGNGAALIGVEDSGGYFTGDTVEEITQELALKDTRITKKVSHPQAMYVFGDQPAFLGEFTKDFDNEISANVSETQTLTLQGIASGSDKIHISFDVDTTQGVIPVGYDASAANQIQIKLHNATGSPITPGNNDIKVTLLKNDLYRQCFAISKAMDSDTWLAGIDVQSGSGCIWKTENSGSSWKPIYGVGEISIRNFVHLNSSNAVLALLSDTAKVLKTTDSGDTWASVTLTGEDTAYCGMVNGGEGGNTGYVLVGTGPGGKVFSSSNNGTSFTDEGQVKAGYDVVWWLTYLSGTTTSANYLAFIHDEVAGIAAPRIQVSTDFGNSWSDRATVGAVGDNWQAAIKLSSGTILCSTDTDGNIYRSTNNCVTNTLVFSAADVKSTETKVRAFAEFTDGTVWAVTQDGGYLWRSDDDGLTWVRECRIGKLASPIALRASGNEMLMIGTGQGLVTGLPNKAVVYRAVARYFED